MSNPRPIQPEDLLALKLIGDVQFSPDGSRLAYVLIEVDASKDDYRSTIWTVPIEGGESIQFTRGPKRDTAPRWAPDGKHLAFLSNREGKRNQIYLLPADGGEPRKLTSLEYGAGTPAWSPDGTQIIFSTRVPKEKPPEDKGARERWAYRPRVITKAQYKADGPGYIFDAISQLFVVNVATSEIQQITFGDCDARGPAWSPDGNQIAFSCARGGLCDYNLFDIWVMQADGSNPHRITENIGRATSPTFSPEGARIACYGTDEQEFGFGDPMVRVWIVPLEGGTPWQITAALDRSVVLLPPPADTPGPIWSRDGTSVTFIIADAGNAHLARASLTDAHVERIVNGERNIQFASASLQANRLAFIATDPRCPSDVSVCAWDGSNETRLTRVNDAWLAKLQLPRVERREFNNPTGGVIEGWVTFPVNRKTPAPLLVEMHGGPHLYHGNSFPLGFFYSYVLASRGWATLALNPTGSGSYSKAFAAGIWGHWGERDLPEQLAAIDALIAEGVADANRLAVSGYSYGGYLTAWTITHTDRFRAAIVGAPVVNHESMHGTSDVGMWFAGTELKGTPFSQRETYRRLAPINYVDRAGTPTLIIHGEADERCPIGQSEELFIGLLAAGKAPTEFVRYPGASHLFLLRGRPSHRVDLVHRVVDWVERFTVPISTGSSQSV